MTRGRKTRCEELRLLEQQARSNEIDDTIPAEIRKDREATRCYQGLLAVTRGSHLFHPADRSLLVMFSETWSIYRKAVGEIRVNGMVAKGSRDNLVISPWVRIRDTSLEHLRGLSSDLGLSPSSRKRLAMVLGSSWDYGEEDFSVI